MLAGEITYTTIARLTAGNIDDIMCTAIEGGIGYWAVLDNSTTDWEETEAKLRQEQNDIPTYSEVATTMLFEGKKIRFFDTDAETTLVDKEDAESVWYLDLEKFTKGCRLYEEKYGSIRLKLETDFDANDADAIIQLALFGEIVFG